MLSKEDAEGSEIERMDAEERARYQRGVTAGLNALATTCPEWPGTPGVATTIVPDEDALLWVFVELPATGGLLMARVDSIEGEEDEFEVSCLQMSPLPIPTLKAAVDRLVASRATRLDQPRRPGSEPTPRRQAPGTAPKQGT